MACCVFFAFHTSFLILTPVQSGTSQENAASQFVFSRGGLRTVTYEVEKQEGQRMDNNGNIGGQIWLV